MKDTRGQKVASQTGAPCPTFAPNSWDCCPTSIIQQGIASSFQCIAASISGECASTGMNMTDSFTACLASGQGLFTVHLENGATNPALDSWYVWLLALLEPKAYCGFLTTCHL